MRQLYRFWLRDFREIAKRVFLYGGLFTFLGAVGISEEGEPPLELLYIVWALLCFIGFFVLILFDRTRSWFSFLDELNPNKTVSWRDKISVPLTEEKYTQFIEYKKKKSD